MLERGFDFGCFQRLHLFCQGDRFFIMLRGDCCQGDHSVLDAVGPCRFRKLNPFDSRVGSESEHDR
jgi:hypothetical protein